MKIAHISDNHSVLPELPKEDFEAIVISGDFFPNHKFGPNANKNLLQKEIIFQTNWLKSKVKEIKVWSQNKPILWSSGNHDFINPCQMLNDNGINTIDLDNKVVEFGGLTWYGFPFIPMLNDDWNWEKHPTDLRQEVEYFLQRLKDAKKFDNLDVIVAHSPPFGILDSDGRDSYGNKFMLNVLLYQLVNKPKAYLTGHIHESPGIYDLNGTIISNAAKTATIIHL